jgi:lauroyl/myristoyl acyltransferase
MSCIFHLNACLSRAAVLATSPSFRQRIRENIHLGFQNFDVARCNKELYNYLHCLVWIRSGLLISRKMADAKGGSLFQVEDACHIDRALEQKNGVLLTTTHWGPSIYAGLWIGRYYPLSVLRLVHDRDLDCWSKRKVMALRQQLESKYMPVRFIDARKEKEARLQVLAENHLLHQTADASGLLFGLGHVQSVHFLNHQVLFARGPFSLSYRTGAPVVPFFMWLQDHRFRLKFLEPINVHEFSQAKETAIARAMQEFAILFEQALRQSPGSWLLWPLFQKGLMVQ